MFPLMLRRCGRPLRRPARRPACRPRLEPLEGRALPSGLQPTGLEQQLLERLNDARANPAAYGAAIGGDLAGVAPAPPLALNTDLVGAARLHSLDMALSGYVGHV